MVAAFGAMNDTVRVETPGIRNRSLIGLVRGDGKGDGVVYILVCQTSQVFAETGGSEAVNPGIGPSRPPLFASVAHRVVPSGCPNRCYVRQLSRQYDYGISDAV